MVCFAFQENCAEPLFGDNIFLCMALLIIILIIVCFLLIIYVTCLKRKRPNFDNESISEEIKRFPDSVIQVKINGYACLALVDSGNPVSLVTENFCDKIDGSSHKFYYRFLNLIGLNGGRQISDKFFKTFMFIEKKKFKINLQLSNAEFPFDIILGSDFLQGKQYSFNPENRTFTISSVSTKIIDVNLPPKIHVAVGEVEHDGEYRAREGVTKYQGHPLLLYNSRTHPNITFSFMWKRNLINGQATYWCKQCQKAQDIQKKEGRNCDQVPKIKLDGLLFNQNPDTLAHICLNENVLQTVHKAEATQIYRRTSRNLRENPAKPSLVWNQMIREIQDNFGQDAQAVSNGLPRKHQMFRTFATNAAIGRPDNINPHDIPEIYQLSRHILPDGRRNLMVRYYNQDPNSPAFVIMMDRNNLKCIHMATDLVFDGTFQYAPSNLPNGQIYTMHASYHNLPNYLSNFLVGIAFVQGRDTATYEQIFSVIRRELISEFGNIGVHKTIHMDHEQAALNAAGTVFPEWTIHSCYFHFIKNLRTHMGDELLRIDNAVRWLNCVGGSCHLPLAWQTDVVNFLMLNLPAVPENLRNKLVQTAHYIETYWMPKFALVNFYGKGGIRTTNAAEGFHNALRHIFTRQHPSFSEAFLEFRDLLVAHHTDFTKYLEDNVPKLRERLYRKCEEKIIRAINIITEEFDNHRRPNINVLVNFSRHVCHVSTPKVNMEHDVDYYWDYQAQQVIVVIPPGHVQNDALNDNQFHAVQNSANFQNLQNLAPHAQPVVELQPPARIQHQQPPAQIQHQLQPRPQVQAQYAQPNFHPQVQPVIQQPHRPHARYNIRPQVQYQAQQGQPIVQNQIRPQVQYPNQPNNVQPQQFVQHNIQNNAPQGIIQNNPAHVIQNLAQNVAAYPNGGGHQGDADDAYYPNFQFLQDMQNNGNQNYRP